jgi:hypothetical protein
MSRHDAALRLAARDLDFGLSPAERAELDAHLAACPACAADARAMRTDLSALAAIPVAPLDPRRGEAILARVLAPERRIAHPLRLVLVAALIALLAFVSLAVGAALLRDSHERLGVVTWTTTEDPDLASREGRLYGVIAGGPGAIAWGERVPRGQPEIWTTVDGSDWVPATMGGKNGLWTVSDIIAGGPGYVAVGAYGSGPPQGIAWTSTDGRRWDRVPDGSGFDGARIDSVRRLAGRYVAIGRMLANPADTAQLALWTSDDGVHWDRATPSLPDGVALLTQPVVVGGTMWALGWGTAPADDHSSDVPVLVSSSDGITWSRSPVDVIGSIWSIDDALYAIATEPVDIDPPPNRRPSLAAPVVPGLYRLGPAGWVRVSSSFPQLGRSLIEVGTDLVMGGREDVGCDVDTALCRPAAWTSSDGGVTWTAHRFEAAIGALTGIAPLPHGRLVAVGVDWSSPAVHWRMWVGTTP